MVDPGPGHIPLRRKVTAVAARVTSSRSTGPAIVGLGCGLTALVSLVDVFGFGTNGFGTLQRIGTVMGLAVIAIGFALQFELADRGLLRRLGQRERDIESGKTDTLNPFTTDRHAVAAVLWLSAVGLLVVATVVFGRRGLIAPLATVALLIVPGELLRRAARIDWPRGAAGVGATDLVLSMGVLVVLGSPFLAYGNFRPAFFGSALLGAVVILAILVLLRGAQQPSPITTAIVLAAAITIATLAMLTTQARPFVADRVSLGQFETVVVVAQQGEVPDSASAFGAETDFPVHYLFYDLALGAVLMLGGFDLYREILQFHASLRVISLALFGLGWFLAGRAFLRGALGERAAMRVAILLPLILTLNRVFLTKFREPLTEGWALGLMGIGIWAVLTTTHSSGRDRRSSAAVAAVALGLLVGISLPALVAAAIFVGSWVITMTAARWRRRSVGDSGFLVNAGWPVVAGPLVGLVLFNWIGRGSIAGLLGGSVDSAAQFPGQAFQALQFMAARPLADVTAGELLAGGLASRLLFTSGFGWIALIVAGVAGLVGVWRMVRPPWSHIVWLLVACAASLGYASAGVAFGQDDVTPWNTIVRNAFYVWVPLSLFMLLGLAFAAEWIKSWLGKLGEVRRKRDWILAGTGTVAFLVVLAAWIPVGAPLVEEYRSSGWIRRPQMTADGHDALRWIATNLPADARVMSSEVTYGSQIIAQRTLVTDGKGTLEDAEVTAATIALLSGANDFFLPARDPRVLVNYDVDYVLTTTDGAYSRGRFGGVPMMRSFIGELLTAEPTGLDDLPYLRLGERFGAIRLYEVIHDRLPVIQDDGLVASRFDLPPCESELCLAYIPAPTEGCRAEELSSVKGRCIVVRHHP